MFKELTAWFSESVNEEIVGKWVSNGGLRTKKFVDADYCFSASCCVEDTKHILDPDPKRRRFGFPVTVIHPSYIETCLSQKRLLDTVLEFALPSEQLLFTVAQQRGDKDQWLLDLLKRHRAHLGDDDNTDKNTELALEKHLGLKRKSPPFVSQTLSPPKSKGPSTTVPVLSSKKCDNSVFANPHPNSVSLREINLSKYQLRLLRLHTTLSAN